MSGNAPPPLPAHNLNSRVAPTVSAAIEKAMQLNRAQRYQAAAEFKIALMAPTLVIDVIGNKLFGLSAQPTLTITNAQIVQTGCRFDEAIRAVRLGIA
jgi:hypothetical protein